jgi:hypothetical protein
LYLLLFAARLSDKITCLFEIMGKVYPINFKMSREKSKKNKKNFIKQKIGRAKMNFNIEKVTAVLVFVCDTSPVSPWLKKYIDQARKSTWNRSKRTCRHCNRNIGI